ASCGKLIDQHEGLEDLERKIIRAIGEPLKRFNEDALRIMRGCRLVAQLEFTLEDETLKAMRQLAANLKEVSGERIRAELFKILESRRPSLGLLALDACGALEVIIPELKKGDGIEQKGFHHQDVMRHNFATCDAAPRSKPVVRLAALLHDIGKVATKKENSDGEITFHNHEVVGEEEALAILERLKCSNEEKERVGNLIRNHMFNYSTEWSDGAVRRFINRVGLDNLEDLFDLRLADQVAIHGEANPEGIIALKERIEDVLKKSRALTVKDLAINGNDLAALEIPRGPIMGVILNELLETVLDDPHQNERERLLTIAKNIYSTRVVFDRPPVPPKQS
ncbi:MAG: HD domain-containing protein, partial [Spirochaetales bacterium]|nr:HD domain-containing protein [Spirochaetales bacterium]